MFLLTFCIIYNPMFLPTRFPLWLSGKTIQTYEGKMEIIESCETSQRTLWGKNEMICYGG